MAVICPTVTPQSLTEYEAQLKTIHFADRLHLDFMDGTLTKTASPALSDITLPHGEVDLHLMFKEPMRVIDTVLALKPSLAIVHAEAEGNFIELAERWHASVIKVGVALLAETPIEKIMPAIEHIDHVLVFSGSLGSFGGTVDLRLLQKVAALKALKPGLEVGWDGGVNDQNAEHLIHGGVDVLNVGGFIQRADNPAAAYATLKTISERDN